jgi:outer membrane cobalamin receptor
VLRLVPGFSLAANGGRGALLSIFPRGGESDYTMVLMNGIPLNAFGGGFDGAHLSIAGIDRMEVVRGPQSAVFGSGAIGGVVNVITRSGGPTQATRCSK